MEKSAVLACRKGFAVAFILLIFCLSGLASVSTRGWLFVADSASAAVGTDGGEPYGTDDSELSIEIVTGMGGYFRLGYWTPVKVTVDNKGSTFSGFAELFFSQGSRLSTVKTVTTYRKRIFLPEYSRSEFTVIANLGDTPRPIAVRLRTAAGKVVLSKEFSVRQSMTTAPVTLVIGAKAGYELLTGAGPGVVSPKVSYLEAREFPTAWLALEGISMIIVHGVQHLDMDPAQLTALSEWVETGGHLVVTDGREDKPVQTVASAMLPVFMSGKTSPMPDRGPNGAKYPADSVGTLSVRKRSARSPWPYIDDPRLGSAWNLGNGQVIYLAFDPLSRGFGSWPLQKELWKELYRWTEPNKDPVKILTGMEQDDSGEAPRLIPQMAAVYHSKTTVFIFCLMYVGGLYLLSASTGRFGGNWKPFWVITAGMALLFSLLGYAVFGLPALRRNTGINEVSILASRPDARYVEVTSFITGFSPGGGRFTMAFRPDMQGLMQTSEFEGDRPSTSFELEDSHANVQMKLPKWSDFCLSSKSISPLPVRIEKVGPSKGQTAYRISNTSSQTIYDSYIMVDVTPISLNDLKPYDTLTVRLPARSTDDLAPVIETDALIAKDRITQEEKANRSLALETALADRMLDGPVFLGWLRHPVWDFVKYGGLRIRSCVGLVLVPLEPPRKTR